MDESLQKLRQEVRAGDVSRLPALILESGRVSRSLYEFLPQIVANKDDLLVCSAVEQTNLCAIRQSYKDHHPGFLLERYPGRMYWRARELAFIQLFDNVLSRHHLRDQPFMESPETLVESPGNPVKIDEVALLQNGVLYLAARAYVVLRFEQDTRFYPATCDLETVVEKESGLPFEQKSVLRLGAYPTLFDSENPASTRSNFNAKQPLMNLNDFLFGNLADAMEGAVTPNPQSPRYLGEFSFIYNTPNVRYSWPDMGLQNVNDTLVLQDFPQVNVTISAHQRKMFAREE